MLKYSCIDAGGIEMKKQLLIASAALALYWQLVEHQTMDQDLNRKKLMYILVIHHREPVTDL